MSNGGEPIVETGGGSYDVTRHVFIFGEFALKRSALEGVYMVGMIW